MPPTIWPATSTPPGMASTTSRRNWWPRATYRVRGLYHAGIDLRYEFAVYNAGNPAWSTADHTGGWLTNHTPPSSALFVPGGDSASKGARPAAGRWCTWAVT